VCVVEKEPPTTRRRQRVIYSAHSSFFTSIPGLLLQTQNLIGANDTRRFEKEIHKFLLSARLIFRSYNKSAYTRKRYIREVI
jgi:hypothetical protein